MNEEIDALLNKADQSIKGDYYLKKKCSDLLSDIIFFFP